MKKILLGLTSLALCVALVGCGGQNTDATITSLSNQLDETANIISNVQVINPTELGLAKELAEPSIYSNSYSAQQSLLNEEYYKMEILNRTAKIKNGLSKNLKLSKAQTSAIGELVNTLSKYSNSVAYTKADMNNAVKQINSLKKDVQKNQSQINAKLTRLNCNSNTRVAFYENILNALQQLEEELNLSTVQSLTTIQNQEPCPQCNRNKEAENEENENIRTPYNTINSNNINRLAGYGMYGAPYGYGMNGYGINGYGFNGYGMNGMNGYGMNYGLNRFGAGYPYAYGANGGYARNTDTYGPMARNIDTYKMPTNSKRAIYGYGIYATTPRLESFDQPDEDLEAEKHNEMPENEAADTQKEPQILPTKEQILQKDDIQNGQTPAEQKESALQSNFQNENGVLASLVPEIDELKQPVVAHNLPTPQKSNKTFEQLKNQIKRAK